MQYLATSVWQDNNKLYYFTGICRSFFIQPLRAGGSCFYKVVKISAALGAYSHDNSTWTQKWPLFQVYKTSGQWKWVWAVMLARCTSPSLWSVPTLGLWVASVCLPNTAQWVSCPEYHILWLCSVSTWGQIQLQMNDANEKWRWHGQPSPSLCLSRSSVCVNSVMKQFFLQHYE